MAENTTILRPLTAEDAETFFVAVFADEDPDPSGYLLKEGRPGTVAELEGLVGWLVEGSSVGTLNPFLFLNGDGRVALALRPGAPLGPVRSVARRVLAARAART